MKMSSDKTPAKMGRVMKKEEKFMVVPGRFLRFTVFTTRGSAVASTGATGIPGIGRRAMPLMMIFSPALSPLRTMRLPSKAGPMTTGL
jgi:hypothetical protein